MSGQRGTGGDSGASSPGPDDGGGGPRSGSNGDSAGGPPPGPNGDGAGADPDDGGGSRLKKWGKRFVIGVVALVGLIVALYLLGVIGVPSVSIADRGDWGEITEERTEIVTTVEVDNPNPFGVKLGNSVAVDYDIRMNGVLLAEGAKSNITIPKGKSTKELSTDLYNDRLEEWWVGYVRADETIDLRANATVDIDALVSTSREFEVEQTMMENATPVINALSASVNSMSGNYTRSAGGGLTGDPVTAGYQIRRGWATWESVTANATTMQVHMLVHNPGDVPIPADPDGVGFETEANGIEMFTADSGDLSEDSSQSDPLIAPNETREVTFSLEMDNDNIDDWFTSHVRNGEVTNLSTQIQLVFRVDATGQEFRIPEESDATHECSFQTAILVDDQAPSSTCQPPEEPSEPEGNATAP